MRTTKGLLMSVLLVVIVGFVAFELAWLRWYGSPVARPAIDTTARTQGSGPSIRYVILGDSTAASQGSTYEEGYAVATSRHLARSYTVTWQNVAVPGARAHDVVTEQLPQVLDTKPDLVLISVGANDVTHLTDQTAYRDSLDTAIKAFQQVNPTVRIVITGAPDMGSVPRLPQPLRLLAGKRSEKLNHIIQPLVAPPQVVFAPIATETGPIFRKHPDLFAADAFHPAAAGYALWSAVLIAAIDSALQNR